MTREATGNSKKPKVLGFALFALLFALCVSAPAQPASNSSEIGFIAFGSPSSYVSRIEAFRGGLRELGYIEGK
jgi:hypothetical protein